LVSFFDGEGFKKIVCIYYQKERRVAKYFKKDNVARVSFFAVNE
jgi:hypothetical protein